MAQQYISVHNLKFLLHEVHNLSSLFQYPYFAAHDTDSANMIIDATKQLADTHLFPFFTDMDRNAPQLVNGQTMVHPQVENIIKAMHESGMMTASLTAEYGGMQLPHMVEACTELIGQAANNGALFYPTLCTGAAGLIRSFGNDTLKKIYLEKMYSNEWQGTMALTEPEAGSSLSDLVTSAEPMADGSYKIKGQKIFISGGDHQYCSNVIHLMLVRIKGAPAGTKGISLMVVPKYRPAADGSLHFNDVTTAGVYHKMGQKGTPAVHLMMGENDDCYGYLVGQEHQGLSYMFQMMNGARIAVGILATGVASMAYYASLEYANERKQGRHHENRDVTSPPVPIIEHADVRRMLLFQKSIVEGSASLVLECSKLHDLLKVTEGDEKERNYLLLEFLTPIVKTYPSEMGVESVSAGMQCLGGFGYCEDFPLEQMYRDIRITPIYEGTTGIQSLDLLGRKMTMKQGRAAMIFFEEVTRTIQQASQIQSLVPYANQLAKTLEQIQAIYMRLMGLAMQGQLDDFLADAKLVMDVAGHTTIAWQWLKQGIVAHQALPAASGFDKQFYNSKLHTLKYYFHYELPKTMGIIHRLMEGEMLTLPTDTEVLI